MKRVARGLTSVATGPRRPPHQRDHGEALDRAGGVATPARAVHELVDPAFDLSARSTGEPWGL